MIIKVGERDESLEYGFRETCFGICVKDNVFFVTRKGKQFSLIGGGVEKNESKEQCLEREFLEEAGLKIKSAKDLCTVDCYWLANGNYPLRSLAHFFVVDVNDEQTQPSESGCELAEVPYDQIEQILPLPYQIAAVVYYKSMLGS